MQILRRCKSVYALGFVDEITEYDYEINEAPSDRVRGTYLPFYIEINYGHATVR